jgi:hypothetical protein
MNPSSVNANSSFANQGGFKHNMDSRSNNINDKQPKNQNAKNFNESFKNITNNQTQNIPQDSAPASVINIKLDHTGD